MSKQNENSGIINEQGFAAGFGFGFSPINESDKKKLEKEETKDSVNNK